MQDWAGGLEKVVGPLGKSPAVRDALRDLGKMRLGTGGSGVNTDPLSRQFERLGTYADRTGGFWNRNVAPAGNLRMPSFNGPGVSAPTMPRTRAPSVGGRMGGVSAPGADSWLPVIALGVIAF